MLSIIVLLNAHKTDKIVHILKMKLHPIKGGNNMVMVLFTELFLFVFLQKMIEMP